jgi:hypothetical protein
LDTVAPTVGLSQVGEEFEIARWPFEPRHVLCTRLGQSWPELLDDLSVRVDPSGLEGRGELPPLSVAELHSRADVSSRLASEFFRWAYQGRGTADGPGTPRDVQFLAVLKPAYPIWRDDPILGPYLAQWATMVLASEPDALVSLLGDRPTSALATSWARSLACNLREPPPLDWVHFVADHLPSSERDLQVEVAFWSWHHQDLPGLLRSLPIGLEALAADKSCFDRSTKPVPQGWVGVSHQQNCNSYRKTVDALLFELERARVIELAQDWRVTVGRAANACMPPDEACFLFARADAGAWTLDPPDECSPPVAACLEAAIRAVPAPASAKVLVNASSVQQHSGR